MRDWSEFLPLVLPSVTGCAEPVAEVALRQAAIEFCEKTLILRRTLDTTRTSAGTAVYDLELERDEALAQLLSVRVGSEKANLTTAQAIDDEPADELRTDLAAYTEDRATMVLAPAPTAAGLQIAVRAALKPAQDADGVADELFQHHARAIADGAIADLCAQPGRPYFNAALAVAKRGEFERAMRDATTGVTTGNARIRLRVKPY